MHRAVTGESDGRAGGGEYELRRVRENASVFDDRQRDSRLALAFGFRVSMARHSRTLLGIDRTSRNCYPSTPEAEAVFFGAISNGYSFLDRESLRHGVATRGVFPWLEKSFLRRIVSVTLVRGCLHDDAA